AETLVTARPEVAEGRFAVLTGSVTELDEGTPEGRSEGADLEIQPAEADPEADPDAEASEGAAAPRRAELMGWLPAELLGRRSRPAFPSGRPARLRFEVDLTLRLVG